MTRSKTIIWVIIAVLAVALVAAVVGIAASVARQATSVVSQVGPLGQVNRLLPFGPGRLVGPIGQLSGSEVVRVAFPGAGLLLALLFAGGIGALIVYAVGPHRGPTAVASAPTPAPDAPGPQDPQYQQFVEWQKFTEWHRQLHAAARPEEAASTAPLPPKMPAAAMPASEMPLGEPTPPDAPTEA